MIAGFCGAGLRMILRLNLHTEGMITDVGYNHLLLTRMTVFILHMLCKHRHSYLPVPGKEEISLIDFFNNHCLAKIPCHSGNSTRLLLN